MSQGYAESLFGNEQYVVIVTKYSPERIQLRLDERIWGVSDEQFSSVCRNERDAITDILLQLEQNKNCFSSEKQYIINLMKQYEAFDKDPELLKKALLTEERRKELYREYDQLDESADYTELNEILYNDHCARYYTCPTITQ